MARDKIQLKSTSFKSQGLRPVGSMISKVKSKVKGLRRRK